METNAQPWLSHYPDGVDWNASVERQPLYEILARTAQAYPDKVAIDFLDYQLTYSTLLERLIRPRQAYRQLVSPKAAAWAFVYPIRLTP